MIRLQLLMQVVKELQNEKHAVKFLVEEENHGNKKELVVQEQDLTVLQYGVVGGVALGVLPRDYTFKINKKESTSSKRVLLLIKQKIKFSGFRYYFA